MVKQGTKGQKEIYEENQETVKYYSLAAVISSLAYFVVSFFVSGENTTTGWVSFALSVVIQLSALFFMKTMARAQLDSRGHVLDAGMDLNDPTAFGEYCKDSIIVTVLCQILGIFSNYAFLFLLSFPAAIGYKFIFSIFLPWATAAPPEEEEVDDKKLRKKERREKFVYRR